MKHSRPSLFCSLFLSFALLILPIPLVAMAESIHSSISDLSKMVSAISVLDKDELSPIHNLKKYLEEGCDSAELEDILDALYYAHTFLSEQSDVQPLQGRLKTVIESIEEYLYSDNEHVRSNLPLRTINARLLVKGKSVFKNNVIIDKRLRTHGRARFYNSAHFKNNVKIDGSLTVQDVVSQNITTDNLTLTGGLAITDLTLNSLSATDIVTDNLQVNNCVSHLCVEDLSAVNGSVSGTLSINDAVVQTLDLVGGLTITDLTLGTATITDAVVDNLQVNNCISNLCVTHLSVTDEVVRNVLDFENGSGNFIGLQAPSVISANYTLSLPSTTPTANQFLRTNAITPTDLEWTSQGGSVPPAVSGVIYVAKYGNDITGDGSFSNPYLTLAKAIDVANSLASVITPITISMSSGIYSENNSASPLAITQPGISIVGDSPTSVIVMPNTISNNLLSANQAVIISNIGFVGAGATISTAAGISLTAGSMSAFNNVHIIGFQTGISCSGGSFDSYSFYDCSFVGNGTALVDNNTVIACYSCNLIGSENLSGPENNGVEILGSTAFAVFDGGVFGLLQTALNISNNAYVTVNSMIFELNTFDFVIDSGAQASLSGSSFQVTLTPADIKIQASGAGTHLQITGCKFDGTNGLGNPFATAIVVSNGAQIIVSSSGIYNYDTALQVGTSSDTSTTLLQAFSVLIQGSATNDILQQGSSSLNFTSSSASGNKISINDPTNVQAAFFDTDDNNALTIGSSGDMNTVLLQPYIDTVNHPNFEFLSSLYSTQGVGFNNEFGNPSTSFVLANNNATLAAITTLRTDTAGVRLVSDTASPVGGSTALRGWDIIKNGSAAQLAFNYQNSDVAGQSVIPEYTVMQLDGVNNQLQLPSTAQAVPQIVFAGDTNLYRSSANVLKTDDNFIVGTLTPGFVVQTNSGTNQLESSTVTNTELSFLSGVTSNVQTQLNGKVAKAGDVMTGTLQLPAGGVASPSLTFTGSTTTGLSANSGNLSLSANGAERMKISSTGVVTIDGLAGAAGVVHNDAFGNLSSSLIMNGDITDATISNTKLATISSSDIPGYIVVRDGSGNFATNMITIDGTVTNPTDVTTKAYVDALVATGFEVKAPALVASTTNVTLSGLQTIDGVALSANDRVLLVGQTNPVENGLWLAQSGAWTRPADFASGTQAGNAYVLVTSGNTYGGASWVCTTPNAVIDTDPLVFAQFSLPSETTGANIGAGTGLVFANKTGETLNFRSLIAGTYLTYTTNTNDITLTTNATSASIANTLVARDGSNNFSANTVTANLIGSASNNLLLTGGTLTGPLQLPAGTVANPSLVFTGSTTTGLSVPMTNTLSFSTNGSQAMSISSTGVVAINDLTPAGVVHNDASGNLSSSLIDNTDIAANAGILDTKLATISTAGKVANSATTATSASAPNTIVLRDGSDNFTANIITATLNGSATNDLPLAGGTLTGTLQLPAGSTSSPSLIFTGNTTTGLSANTGNLSFSTIGLERMAISSGGVVSIDNFTIPGVVHNDASGNLSTSLIVNADIDPAAAIVDTKLATISTAGKVANSATTATSANNPSTIVLRDASQNFSAGTITANLIGNATTATSAGSFTGSLAGDVTGTQSATVVSFVGGQTAAAVAAATVEVNAATSSNTPSTLVLRDNTGSFAAQNITAAGNITMVDGIASGFISIPTTSSLAVGTIQQNGVSLLHTFGTSNTFVGDNAGNFTAGIGSSNTAVGTSALAANTTGSSNTAVGAGALTVNTIGSNNTAVGSGALFSNTTGVQNTAVGSGTLAANTIGTGLTALGKSALLANTTGINNTAVGTNALATNAVGTTNTAVGFNALTVNTVSGNTAVGSSALASNTTGVNTAVGSSSLIRNTTGTSNTAVGTGSLAFNTIGNNNTAIGTNSLVANTTGLNNTAVGALALSANTTGLNNTAVGVDALQNNVTGSGNTAIGSSALAAATGSQNTALGVGAGQNITTGTNNVMLGYDVGQNTVAGANNIYIDGNSLSPANESNTIRIGNTQTAAYMQGIFGVSLTTPQVVTAVSGGQLGSATAVSLGTSANTPNTLVARDVTGSFAAQNITAVGNITMVDGIASGFISIPTTSSLAVGTIQQNGVSLLHTFGISNTFVGDNAGNFTAGIGSSNTAVGTSALAANTTGASNTAVGASALVTNTIGAQNTAVGNNALTANTTGTVNTAVGFAALQDNTTGTQNTAIGNNALGNNVSGTNNTAVGRSALLFNTVSNNTAVGYSALGLNTTGVNTAIGANALAANTTGSHNTAIGLNALLANTTATDNTAVGENALAATTVNFNTAVGSGALAANTTGVNTAVGANALAANTTGTNNTAVGQAALQVNTIGANNTALGNRALNANTTGGSNTAVGSNALVVNTIGTSNTALGVSALAANTTGNNNTAIGGSALSANSTGTSNTAVGASALSATTVGSNTAVGASALLNNTTGVNTAVGFTALGSNTIGTNNTAVGASSLIANTTGIDNTAVGASALATNSVGTNNTAVGFNALTVNTVSGNTAVGTSALAANTTGTGVTAVGISALGANTTGINNTAVGSSALTGNTTGTNNIAMGSNALATNTSGSFNTAIGFDALNANTVSSNTAVGNSALAANTTGTGATAVGSNALAANTTGFSNTAVGASALATNTVGTTNTAVGFNALHLNTFSGNTAVGSSALAANTTGTGVTAVGLNALAANTVGINNTAVGNGALSANTTGVDNTAVGASALSVNTIGTLNTAVGNLALAANTTGGNNTAVGYNSLPANTIGISNTAIGTNSLSLNTTGIQNTAIGASALATNTVGTTNTAIGFNALTLNTVSGNTAVGSSALQSNTTGVNTAVGLNALAANTIGTNNTAVGNGTLAANTTGSTNTAIGSSALAANTIGISNVAIGSNALFTNTTGLQNTAVGSSALTANTIGFNNTALGYNSLTANTTGVDNTAVGFSALASNTVGTTNTAVGYNALVSNTISGNTAVGSSALQSNTTGSGTAVGASALAANTIGANNTAVGNGALQTNTTGNQNTAVGANALLGNTTGTLNTAMGVNSLTNNTVGGGSTAIGSNALSGNTTGAGNTAVGASALQSNITGSLNTAVGSSALDSNTTGNNNVAIGASALLASTASGNVAVGAFSLVSNTTGTNNIGIGFDALNANTIGTSNTAVGTSALISNTTGVQNTAFGASAGVAVTTGTNNVLLGYNIGGALVAGNNNIYIDGNSLNPGADESSTIRIGNTQTKCFIQGIFGAVSAGSAAALVNASGQLGTTVSSIRFKHDVQDMVDKSNAIFDLRPVTFVYNSDETEGMQYGLVAEEVDAVFPDLVLYDENGQPFTVRYEVLPVLLLNEMKKQKEKNEQYDLIIQNLLDRVSALESCA